ncbi:LysR family transcriptional regulator [Sodalis sp. dw_96]|uniref:LysR family transcriptional regulator n=1 Tax=Sodalis sp. dw_96 TaxID=2719794 RepID=UPI001BD3C212|nr:LysR family transcriptional regulator [Sodalis sp. dw_96]
MDEKDWLIVHTVWLHKNITRAAEQLYTSQPALSYRLRQIERKLGIRLFKENERGQTFTAQGRYLAQRAESMLSDFQQLKQTLHNLDKPQQGELRIGVSSNYAAYRLPDKLALFSQRYPDISINLISGYSEEIFQQLQREAIHLAIVKDHFGWREGKQLIEEDDYYLISHQPLDLARLPQLPQIRISHGPHISQLIERWWNANYSTPPRVAMTVDKLEVCQAMVAHGLGYAIVSSYLAFDDRLYRIPVTIDGQPLKNRTWLLYRHISADASVMLPFVGLFG